MPSIYFQPAQKHWTKKTYMFFITPQLSYNEEKASHDIACFILADFFENEPNEICSHLSKKSQKAGFFALDKLLNHTSEKKWKEKRKI